MAAGYVLSVIGSFRVLFGDRGQTRSALASLGRILYGLVVTIGFIIGALLISAAVRRNSGDGARGGQSLGSGGGGAVGAASAWTCASTSGISADGWTTGGATRWSAGSCRSWLNRSLPICGGN